MKPLSSNFAMAWSLTLAPLFLFIPALMLADMGPCAFAHPMVIVVAFLFFIFLEVAALPCFVKAARAAGRAIVAMIGMGLAALLLMLCVVLEYYVVAEYWADAQFGM